MKMIGHTAGSWKYCWGKWQVLVGIHFILLLPVNIVIKTSEIKGSTLIISIFSSRYVKSLSRCGQKYFMILFKLFVCLGPTLSIRILFFIVLSGPTNHRMEMLKMRLFHFLALVHPQWSWSDSKLFQIQFWSIYCISNGQSCRKATWDGRERERERESFHSPSFGPQIINPTPALPGELN